MKTHLIGIDPSFDNCGISIYHPATNIYKMQTGNFMEAMSFLNESGVLDKSIVLLENPDLDGNTFGMWAFFKVTLDKLLRSQAGLKEVQQTFGISMKRAQDIGKSKAAGAFMLTILEAQGVPVIQVAPSKRDRADKVKGADVRFMKMPTKTTAAQFATLTGYTGKSNEHARDAGTLVCGRTIEWAERQLMLRRK